MAYSFQNQNMSTLSNILIIHAALDKGETADTTALDKVETADTTDTTADTTAFTIPREVMTRVMKTSYGKFVVTNSIPCLRVVLADGTISSASVASTGVVTLTAPAKGKLIIDGTLDIECNY
jgi:hypothetical protein